MKMEFALAFYLIERTDGFILIDTSLRKCTITKPDKH